MFKFWQKVLCIFLFMLLFVVAERASAEEELFWPAKRDLMVKVWSKNDVQTWGKIGDVRIWNTRDTLYISVKPYDPENPEVPYIVESLNINISMDDTEDFIPFLNKVGKPVPQKFNYPNAPWTVDPDTGEYVFSLQLHTDLDICWGIPENCPTINYIIVHANLARLDPATGDYANIGEGAFASGDGNFLEITKTGELLEDGIEWGWYNTYQIAKVETGHFVDAKVKGLTYATPTQEGVSGDSGNFDYIPDERVDFSLGNLYLGHALANRNVTPYDLYDGEESMSDDQALNVAWLLQNLDADGDPAFGPIVITDAVIASLNGVLSSNAPGDFSNEGTVGALIGATQAAYALTDPEIPLAYVTRAEALTNLGKGQRAENIVKKNISKTPDMKSDKAKIEIMPVYVPAQTSDDTPTDVVYYDEAGNEIETRDVAKPIVVSYLEEVEGTGAMDLYVAVSRDDGDTWKRRNISRTAGKSSLAGFPGESSKPMLKVKDNKIFVAWTDKYCRGGRPGYSITVCPDEDLNGEPDACEVCRDTDEAGEICTPDYPGDDEYYQNDIFGVGGPQRSVIYEDYPDMGEVPYNCVWTARGVIDPATGDIQWFKPERLTSGRRDAFQLFAGAGTDVAFAIVWQEDPKGLVPGEGDGPGEGWSGANTNNKTDIWYSYITLSDFDKIDYDYPEGGLGDGDDDMVDTDPELAGRVKALVPMSLPVKITDNDVCSAENMNPDGGGGEHDYDEEGEGTHRYCGEVENIGTAEAPGSNPLCVYTVEKTNPKGEIHNVCVTADGRFLDGNTGASRPNIFLQPYKKPDGSKSAWVIIGYEESKGVGIPPDGEHDDDSCGTADDYMPVWPVETSEDPEDRYKPDMGKNVIYHSFDLFTPETVAGGGIINLPETDAAGNEVYLVDEFGDLLLDWKGDPQLAYENARRVRFVTQPKSKAGTSKTVLVALYREGEEGSGKPADIFMRRLVAPSTGNPYAFTGFQPGAQNISSVTPTTTYQDPFDSEKPIKMLRWSWTDANLADSSGKNPFSDARAHRGALNGDELILGYSWTPNWGRKANDKYDFLIRRSFDGGQAWTTDPADTEPIDHNVVFRVPVEDEVMQTVTWEEEVVTTTYGPGAAEPPRNVSNLRNNRISVLEPRLVKTPGAINNPDGTATGYPEDLQDTKVYQLAYGTEFNQNSLPDDVVYPKTPMDINYSRTKDKGQRYESVIVTPQGGSGSPEEGWNPLANDKPQQGAAQIRQTPDGSRMYGIWLEESLDKGSDILFRRVDYRPAPQQE